MAESCTLLIHFDKGTPAVANEIKEALEGNNVFAKVEAMKKAIMLLLNGETILSLISTIGQVVRSDDFNFTIRKLTLLYLEIMIGKAVSRGRVLTEVFTMTCHVLRSNLHYPNVYIQGLSLRFLGRLNNPHMIYDIIYIATSLFSLVLIKLRHSHPYVRRNAILAVTTFCKLLPRERFLVDTPWTIKKVLSTEQDPSVKRNALLMLSTCAQDIAVNYLITHFDQILDWGEQLQMVVLELIRKVCRTNEHEKGKYFKIIRSLLTAPSTVVIYECAGTFVSLSSAPTAIRAAVDTYCKLLQSQSDKNVKLIVLDRLQELKTSHKVIMIEMIMDVLRALSSANLLNRGETLDIVLELITPWNVVEVIYLLKEEVVKTQNAEHEKIGDYRQMLGQVIDICTIKYSEVASTWTVPVVDYQLEDFLSDANVASPKEFVLFVRKVLETDRGLWVSIISRLLDTFDKNRCARSCSRALWIIGEYCRSLSEVESGIATIKQCLGELPFYTTIEEGDGQEAPKGEQLASATTVSSRRPMVLADGTYATQSAALETAMSPRALVQGSLSTQGNLRSLLLSGNFLLGAVVACTLAKLVLRLEEVQPSQTEVNKAITQALLYMFSTIQLGQSPVLPHPIDNDAYDIIVLCIRLLCNTGNETRKIWPHACRESFLNKLADNAFLLTEERKAKARLISLEEEEGHGR